MSYSVSLIVLITSLFISLGLKHPFLGMGIILCYMAYISFHQARWEDKNTKFYRKQEEELSKLVREEIKQILGEDFFQKGIALHKKLSQFFFKTSIFYIILGIIFIIAELFV